MKGPESPSDRDYQGGFAAALILQDLRLAAQAAELAHDETPMGAKARDLFEAFAEAGQGGLDLSAIIKALEPR